MFAAHAYACLQQATAGLGCIIEGLERQRRGTDHQREKKNAVFSQYV